MSNENKAPLKNDTPFLNFSGRWMLSPMDDRPLEWGHRFDAGIGYRVFIKYKDSDMINAFPADMAEHIAQEMLRHKNKLNIPFEYIKKLAAAFQNTAAICRKLNDEWAAAGAPDEPLHEALEGGNA